MGCGGSKGAAGAPSAAAAAPEKKEEAKAAPVDETADNVKFLGNVQLFQRLPAEELPGLAKAAAKTNFDPGQVIIKQGDTGSEFFLIKNGQAKVEISEDGGQARQVATLKAGDFFGEMGLLRDEPRTATITAATKLETLKITRASFTSLGLNEKIEFAKRGAVGAGAISNAEIKPPTSKNDAQKTLISNALKGNANIATMVTLDQTRVDNMIELMWLEDCASGTEIIVEGDLEAHYFYIVQEGEFEIKKKEEGQSADKAQALGTIGAGKCFGELALLYFAPRAASIVAKSNGKVWVMARQQFKSVLAKSNDEVVTEHVKYLDKVQLLGCLKDKEKKELAAALSEFSFSKGETLFDQGDPPSLFYILIQGEVQVVKDGKEVAKLTGSPKEAQFFGETALLTSEARTATIKVLSEEAKCLTVDKATFDMILGSLAELKARGKDGTAEVKKQTAAASNASRFGLIKRKDLKRLGLLGCGGFGAVEMVEHVTSQDTYALKALSKGYVVKSGMQASVMSEKNVQLMCDSVFVVKLYETFNGEQSLYLLLELALGGELYATFNKKGMWGNEACAQYYIAGTVFAFDHLHSRKIIFRDLKPENLLLNDLGHPKLTDMGLAKVCAGKTHTTCGTPDYFAPEIVKSAGHNNAVDWWCLGILTFELLSGHPPFESATPMQIYSKVTKGINKVQFPKKCKGKAEDFIKSLCNQNPSERLPMKKGGVDNIKKHGYYDGFSWADMESFKMTVPYKPAVKGKKDIANFNARKEDMPPQIPYKDPGTGWDKDFATST